MGPLVATRVMANIPDIPIIIQISWSLWFQKSMTLDVCPDIPKILNISNIYDIPDIATIPEIPFIIQISSSLWFQKMYDTWCLSVSPDIPHILDITDIPSTPDIPSNPDIPTIPDIPKINQISLSLWFQKCITLGGVCLSILTFTSFLTLLKFLTFMLFLKFPIFQISQSTTMLNFRSLAQKMAKLY